MADSNVTDLKQLQIASCGQRNVGPVRTVYSNAADSLWDRVEARPNGCWEWTGASRHPWGYGMLQYEGKFETAHRVSYQLVHGEIPLDLFVCHSCDNPPCCRPDHLFIGSAKDNTRDMLSKNRHHGPSNPSRGEKHYRAKLTDASAIAIREAREEGITLREIAESFGVAIPTVFQVVKGKTWSHLG